MKVTGFTLDRDWHSKGEKPKFEPGDILVLRGMDWLIDKQAWILVFDHIGHPVTEQTPIEIRLV